jgi:membrane-bound ClpP family serine protease
MKALTVLKYAGFGILGVAFVIAVIFGVQALWNWLIPELFNGPVLTYWQTAGLFLLSKILLTGVAPGSSEHQGKKEWKKKYGDKFRSSCRDEEKVASPEQV